MQLHHEGLLYMNNLPYFWKVEDKNLRGDQFDGVDRVHRGSHGLVTPAGHTGEPIAVSSWNIREHPPDADRINIFCMIAARPTAHSVPIDKRNLRFGDTALMMTRPQVFIDRIASHLRSNRIRGKTGLVQYVGEDHTGDLGPFRKLETFAYQSEWRLVCYGGPGGARQIQIGSIADVSVVLPVEQISGALEKFLI